MEKIFTLILAIVTTTSIWAYDFQSGDLYYNITSETTVEVTNGDYSALTVATISETIIYNDTTYSVTSIGDEAFAWCSNLTSITIPNSVTSIGGGAFFLCESLISITIPNSVTSIGDAAFRECYNLTSVTIGNSVTSIGEMAFEDCWSLISITIPNSVTSIGWAAFRGCYHITSITIPNSVTSIGDYAFQRCSDFTSMIVESGNSTYDSRENCNAIIETATNTLIAGCQNTIIPNSVTSIREYAFQDCSDLTSITIPNSVTSIGDAAFNWCSSLTTVICKAIEVPELESNVFNRIPLSEATLYVPAESIEKYKSADQWKDFGTILPIHESPTNIEHTPLGEIGNQSKLLRNGQVYILQDGKTYTIMGQEL